MSACSNDATPNETPNITEVVVEVVVGCDSPYEGYSPLQKRRDTERVRVMEQQLAELSRQLAELRDNQHQAQKQSECEKEELLAALEAAHKRELKQRAAVAADSDKLVDMLGAYEQKCRQLEDKIDGLEGTIGEQEKTIANLQRGNRVIVDRMREEVEFGDEFQADATDTVKQLLEMVDTAMEFNWEAREVALECYKFMKAVWSHDVQAVWNRASELDALNTVLAMNQMMQLQGQAIQERLVAHAPEVPRFDAPEAHAPPLAPAEADCDGGNETDDTGGNCVVCFERPRDALFKPCGHAMCCSDCATLIREQNDPCPICRTPIIDEIPLLTPEKADHIHRHYAQLIQQSLAKTYKSFMKITEEESTKFQLGWAQCKNQSSQAVSSLVHTLRQGVISNTEALRTTILQEGEFFWAESFRSYAEHYLLDGSSDPALCKNCPKFEQSLVLPEDMATKMTEYNHILYTHAQKRASFDECPLFEEKRQMSKGLVALTEKLNTVKGDPHLDAKARNRVKELLEIASGNAKDANNTKDRHEPNPVHGAGSGGRQAIKTTKKKKKKKK